MMEKIKFLIIGAVGTDNTTDLESEITKRGHSVIKVKPKDFIYKAIGNKFSVFSDGVNLKEFDIYILRGVNLSFENIKIFSEMLVGKGKVVIDQTVGGNYILSKLSEAARLSMAGLNYPRTLIFSGGAGFREATECLNYPVVVKPVKGQKGQGIEKIENEAELENFFEGKNKSEWLVQEFLPMESDVRVLVVGGEALGAFQRTAPEGDFRTNISVGGSGEKVELTTEMKKISEKAASIMGLEIAGVDLTLIKGEWYIIEVNFAPQWQGFKKATGINPVEKIIDYAIRKYEKRKN